jgi:ABC-type uncharacterized transport system substrate-binding protein
VLGAAVAAKQLGLLKEAAPNISRFAGLWNPANVAFQTLQVKEAKDAARTRGVELQLYEAKAPDGQSRSPSDRRMVRAGCTSAPTRT